MDNIEKKVRDAVEEHIEMLVRKKANMSPPDIELLCKDLCALETLNRIEGNVEENFNMENSGNSYRRGRAANGRFTSRDSGNSGGYYDGGSGNSGARYYDGSGNSGYSGHSRKDRTIAHIEELMDVAQNEQERQFLQKMMERYQ